MRLPTQPGLWWYDNPEGDRRIAEVYRRETVSGDELLACDGSAARLDDPWFSQWIGPVNPEPLPMPLAESETMS